MSRTLFCFLSLVLASCHSVVATALADEMDRGKFFEERVHPILAKRCYSCHGPEKQESGLRLDSREAILKGGDSGTPGAVVGEPAKSALIQAVRHEGEVKMPPDEKLPDAEIAVMTEWVTRGLAWSQNVAAAKVLTPEALAEQARREHWSLQPVRRPPFPNVVDQAWANTGIDYFVRAKLEDAGLTPSRAADRRTLLRRLSLDLWGLPPTDEEVEGFLADPAPDAYLRQVDRWLASPRYGERWGRHWLDVARYADTRGYAFANDRRYPYAYTYRDYVLSALNADKPYNEFVMEQLAADQLPPGEDKTRLAAMGFLTTGRKFNNRQDDLDDQIDVVSRGLLGLTVSCARCHDHKYDPVPTEDYYSLYGVFASSQEPSELPLIAEPQQSTAYAKFQQEMSRLRAELESYLSEKHSEILKQSRERVAEYLALVIAEKPESRSSKVPGRSLSSNDIRPKLLDRWRSYVKLHAKSEDPVFGPWSELSVIRDAQFSEQSSAIVAKWHETPAGTQKHQLNPRIQEVLLAEPPSTREEVARRYGAALVAAWEKWVAAGGNSDALGKLPAEEKQLAEILVGKDAPTDIARSDLSGYLNRADRNRQRELEKKILTFEASSPVAPPRAMVLQEDKSPYDPRVLLRGNAGRPGKPVPRQFLLVIAGADRKPFQLRSGRLELAQSIVDPSNPLTRRVIANRVWMHHFGQSLVRTPSDFGTRCERPLHAELLDYLAARLLESQWSLKSLHREILLSSSYQQASVDRPEASAKDPENWLLWRMNRQRLEFEPMRDALLAAADQLELTMGGRPVDLLQSPSPRRRTVYGNIDRQDLPNLLRVFDFPSPDQSQAERPRTTVPQQSLFLMNSPFVIEQAKGLAARLQAATFPDSTAKILALYRLLFQRQPSATEIEAARQFVQAVDQDPETKNDLSSWQQLAQLLLLTNEFAYVD